MMSSMHLIWLIENKMNELWFLFQKTTKVFLFSILYLLFMFSILVL